MNYVEGQAFIGGQAVTPAMIGSAAQLQSNQSLITHSGRAEMLLTPGAFLRLGPGGSVKMIAPSLAGTTVQIERGHAMVEADHIFPQSNLLVQQAGATIRIEKQGLYDFNAVANTVRVYDGKAVVTLNGRNTDVGGGHELFLNGPFKTQKFDRDRAASVDDLYQWSQARSAYVAEANVGAAQAYVPGAYAYGMAPWFGDGWYWNPWYDAYTFVPDDGIFFSPFGWGFYSPIYAHRAPLHPGFGYRNHFTAGFRYGGGRWGARAFAPGGGFAARSGGFRGGYGGGFAGGFHGGAGGFHGGGHGGGGHGR